MTRTLRQLSVFAAMALAALTLSAPTASARKARTLPAAADAPTEDQIAVRQLRQQIAAEELALALDLSEDQRDQLAALVEEAVAQRTAQRTERRSRAGDARGLLQDYLGEVQTKGAPSDATVASLRELRSASRPDPEVRRGQHEEVREQLQTILDEEQRRALREFRPMKAVGPDPTRVEHRQRRGERVRERMNRDFDQEDIETLRTMRKQRERRKGTRKTLRNVLFSPEMLDVLTR